MLRRMNVDSVDDRRAVVEVHQRSRPLSAWDAVVVERHLADPSRWSQPALVAEDKGRIVGMAQWLGELPLGGQGVFAVCVVPEARGRGLGSALLAALAGEVGGLPAGCAVYVDRDDKLSRRFAISRLGCELTPHAHPTSFWLELGGALPPVLAAVQEGGGCGEVREVAANDPLVLDAVDLLRTHNPHHGDDGPVDRAVDALRRDIELGGFLQVALDDDGSVVGVVATCVLPFTGFVYSSYTVTHAEHRRRGIGWTLKVAQAHLAAARGATGIVTDVPEADGPMARLLRRAGYDTWDRRMARTTVVVSGGDG